MSDLEVGPTSSQDIFGQLLFSIENGGLDVNEWEKLKKLPAEDQVILESLIEPSIKINGKKYDTKTAGVLVAHYGDVTDRDTVKLAKIHFYDGPNGDHRPIGDKLRALLPKELADEYFKLRNTYFQPSDLQGYNKDQEINDHNYKMFEKYAGKLRKYAGKLEKLGYGSGAVMISKEIGKMLEPRGYKPICNCVKIKC